MTAVVAQEAAPEFDPFLARYDAGEWRAMIFRDLVLSDVRRAEAAPKDVVVLDVGCGDGFDADGKLQAEIARSAGTYIGVEPDSSVEKPAVVTTMHRCVFEDAPIAPGTVHVAFAVMVLEHLENPERFWSKMHAVLRPGGVFWGFTVDARHPFVAASRLAERLHVKDRYLKFLHGSSPEEYKNYQTWYRSNTPREIARLTRDFRARQILHFGRAGQLDYYFPRPFVWVGRLLEGFASARGIGGSILAVRASK